MAGEYTLLAAASRRDSPSPRGDARYDKSPFSSTTCPPAFNVHTKIDGVARGVYHPMVMPASARPTLILVLAALSTGIAGTTALSTDRALDPGLDSRLRSIESAFRQGDASALRLSFSGTGKVCVNIRDLTEAQASYGAGQLEVIFAQIFEAFPTKDFDFEKDEMKASTPGTAFARGRWVRRSRPGNQEAVDTLTFTLRQEGEDWRVLEIRSSR